MESSIPAVAGSISTVMFLSSMVPMVTKAFTTRDLRSYSLSHLALTQFANLIHSIYIFSLPVGPIWVLHSFYVAVTGVMLVMFVYSCRLQDEGSQNRKNELNCST